MSHNTQKTQALFERAKRVMPWGVSSNFRYWGDETPVIARGEGAYVWDADGNRYLDYRLAFGPIILGHADQRVNERVAQAMANGTLFAHTHPLEIEVAERLIHLCPGVEKVRFANSGTEATMHALRIARAHTGREIIAFCGYHGWADWYLATNLKTKDALAAHLLKGLEPKGVPKCLRGSIIPFRYNHPEELEAIIKKHGKLAAIIMEPLHGEEPKKGFLKQVRKLADKAGAVLVFDEITMGFRLTLGGAHLKYGVMPDMAIFAKGMSNGYPMAAIIGRKKIMQAAQGTFISSTYWTEAIGPVAALATIKKMREKKVQAKLATLGRTVRAIWMTAAKKHGLPIVASGPDPLLFFSFAQPDGQTVKTVFVTEMLKRGFLASNLYYASYAHTDADLKRYGCALNEVFALIVKAQKEGRLQKLLKGPVAHTGFSRLN